MNDPASVVVVAVTDAETLSIASKLTNALVSFS